MLEEMKKRKKVWFSFAAFLLLMFVSSLIAKGIYTSGLPQIETAFPTKNSILHEVNVQGIVRHSKESALNLVSGLRIEEIFTRVGNMITEEDVLFQVDMADLKEQIKAQERNIQKLNLQLTDAQTNIILAEQKKETTKIRAEEDYKKAGEKVDKQISDADIAVHNAQKAIDEHNERKPSINENEKKSAETAYTNWSTQKEAMTKVYENAALAKDDADKEKETAERALKEAEERGEGEDILGGLRDAVNLALTKTQEKTKEFEEAKKELDNHMIKEVRKPDYSAIESQISAWEATKRQLEQVLKDAQKNKIVLGDAKEDELENAGRVLEDSQQQTNADSTAKRYTIEIEEANERLQNYKEIYEKEGKIKSSKEGMVIACNAATGERTNDTPILKIADTSENQPFEFWGTITKEQKKHVNLGDEGEIMLFGESKILDAQVDYLMENDYVPDTYDITAILPQGVGYISASGTLMLKAQSESYLLCVPAQAIYTNSNGDTYVYELGKKETILGTEMAVRVVVVKVVDKNERYAAIQEGGLIDSESELVIATTKELKEGASVRYKEW